MSKEPITTIYDLDYFSGSQMFLYIGDVWVDEITSLTYQTTQNKTPLYGYASQLLDDSTAGRVIVNGTFTINFKEQGYLWAVLRRQKQFSEAAAGLNIKDDNRSKKRDDALFAGRFKRPVGKANATAVTRAGIERLVNGEATKTERFNFYNDLASYATFDVKSPRDTTFENIAEVFEDQLWDKSVTNQGLNSQIRRTDDNQFDDFDMYVVFGNYANPGANHTTQKIIGVRLTSQGKTVNIDGSPVQEQYSFFAKSVA